MESISNRIAYLNVLVDQALLRAKNYMRSLGDNYNITPTPTPKNDAILFDPTYKPITPPPQPPYPGFGGGFPTIPPPGTFTGVLPSSPVFNGSSETIEFSEAKISWLLDIPGGNSTRDAIEELFNGTGYEDVEIDMWEKGSEKDLQALRDSEDDIISSMGAKGFTMPNDIINRAIELKVAQPYDNTTLKRNSDIFLEQMGIAQKNAQFGITAGLGGEDILWGYHSRMASRALDVAITVGGLGLILFEAKTRQYNAYLRGKKTAMQGAVEVEESMILNYNEFIGAHNQRLYAYVTAVTTLKNNYRSALRGYKSEIRSEGEKTRVIMSWRRAQYKEALTKLQSELNTDISNMMSYIATDEINMHIDASSALYFVHHLASLLSSLQVLIDESTAFEESVIE